MRAPTLLLLALAVPLAAGCKRGGQTATGAAAPCATAEACQAACATCGESCEPQAARACVLAAEHALRGERLDLSRAAEHYRVACEQGLGKACAALGNQYQDGRGV